VAGGTDVMVAGTIAFIEGIVKELDSGTKPESTLNEPKHPRRSLT
jgi:hypothetical protein